MPINIAATATHLQQRAFEIAAKMNKRLEQDFVTQQHLTIVRTMGDYIAPNIAITEVIQSYQGTFTPKNNVTISSEINSLQQIKVDIDWTEPQLNSLLKKWRPETAQFGDQVTTNRYFTDYLLMEHFYPRMKEELELSISFKGIYVAPTVGTAGLTINSVDGFRRKIQLGNAAGSLTYYALGTVTPANILASTRSWVRSLPIKYQESNQFDKIFCSQTYLDMFSDATITAGMYVIDHRTQTYVQEINIPGTNKRLVALPSMQGSMGLWMTKKENLLMLLPATKMADNKGYEGILPVINWEAQTRNLKGWGNAQLAFGWEYSYEMFCSENL
jgi:hypothetical protein